MKKTLLAGFAIPALLLASCSSDEIPSPVNDGNVTFTAKLPANMTRAYADGNLATQLTYCVYEAGTKNIIVKSGDEGAPAVSFIGKVANLSLNLVKGKSYDVVFWADVPGNSAYTFNPDDQTISIDYTGINMGDENRDAFFQVEKGIEVAGSINKTVELRRPFAQINWGTNDLTTAEAAKVKVTSAEVTVSNAYNTLNLFTGLCTGETPVTFAKAPLAQNGNYPVEGYTYLAMDYVLTGVALEGTGDAADVQHTQSEIINASLTVFDDNDQKVNTLTIDNVPVQRNYRTNIYGALLTSSVDYTVVIEPDFFTPDNDIEVVATNAQQLVSAINSGKNVILDGDIEIPNSVTNNFGGDDIVGPWTLVRKDIKVVLNGHKLVSNSAFVPQRGATITVEGKTEDGGRSTIICNANPLFQLQGGSIDVKDTDIIVDYKSNASSAVFPIQDNSHVKMTNCSITAYGIAIPIGTNASSTCKNITFDLDNVEVTSCIAVLINQPVDFKAKECKFSGGYHAFIMRGGNYDLNNCEFTQSFIGSNGNIYSATELEEMVTRFDNKYWDSGNIVPLAAVTMGNYSKSGYRYPTVVNMKDCNVVANEMYKSQGIMFPAVYVHANQEDGMGVTFNYDDATRFTGELKFNSSNILVNGSQPE